MCLVSSVLRYAVAWLARLDARAREWPSPVQWVYQAAKAYLIVSGAIALGRVLLDRIGLWPF